VRKLLNGSEGTLIGVNGFKFSHTASVSAIEAEIKQSLGQLATEWGVDFEDAPTSLNRANLAIVAFVQNAQSYQILGSAMASVK